MSHEEVIAVGKLSIRYLRDGTSEETTGAFELSVRQGEAGRGDGALRAPAAPAARARLGAHQIFERTCPLPRTMMSTTARSKKLVMV